MLVKKLWMLIRVFAGTEGAQRLGCCMLHWIDIHLCEADVDTLHIAVDLEILKMWAGTEEDGLE